MALLFCQFYRSILVRVLVYKQQELTVYLGRKWIFRLGVHGSQTEETLRGVRARRHRSDPARGTTGVPSSPDPVCCALSVKLEPRGRTVALAALSLQDALQPPGDRERDRLLPSSPSETQQGAQVTPGDPRLPVEQPHPHSRGRSS